MASRPLLRSLPYLTFAGVLVLGVAFTLASISWEKGIYARQDQNLDPKTGTWYPSYDWRADNRHIETVTSARVVLLWVLVAHGVVDSLYAAAVLRGWRGIVLGLAFLVLSGFLALILLVGSVAGGGMIG